VNYLDIIIAIPLLWGIYKGITRGVVFEIALLMALILGIMGGVKLSKLASAYVSELFNTSSTWLPYMSFLFVFIIIVVLVLLFAKLLESMLKLSALGLVNKIAGAVFGMLKWAFILSVVLHLFKPIDKRYHIIDEQKKQGSFLFHYVSDFATLMIPALEENYRKISIEI
jgi:membrane protein required for colicin V production